MTLKNLQNNFQSELKGLFPPEEINSFYYLLCESLLGLNRLSIALDPQKNVNQQNHTSFVKALNLLKKEYPIQYIIGETEFMGLTLKVNEHVLIPRPETEELIDWIITSSHKKEVKSFVDIGTGSGCIAVALAKQLPKASAKAIDISNAALQLAKLNAINNEVNISFSCQDILNTDRLPNKFDIIVSNPPYVRECEKKEMHNNVLKYEPDLALYVPDEDPLLFYKKIAELALNSLNPGGFLFFEINQYLGNELLQLLDGIGFNSIEIKTDLYGADRMIRAVKN